MPSVMQRVGTPNAQHNLENAYRKHLENVNPELSKYNETIRQKSVEDIYAEHLQPAFEKFNEKQRRKDRRLDVKYGCDTYLEYQRALDKKARASQNAIDQKGRPPIREIVWQFGNPEQGYGSKGQTDESRERIKGMLLEVQSEAERRYPQFVWGDIVFHADEESLDAEGKECGSLHIHSSFVPLCFQNKQGTEVQVAFERCLHEMGFSSFEAWKHDLDNIMESVLEKHGLERTVMDNHNEHQESREFHRQQKLIRETKELEYKVEELQSEMHIAENVKDATQELAAIYQREADEAQDKLIEARESLESAKQDNLSLQAEKTALKGEIDDLTAKREVAEGVYNKSIKNLQLVKKEFEEMKRELPVLQEQISEAKSELNLVNRAIKEKKDEGGFEFGRASLDSKIAELKERDKRDRKLSLLEKFVELPQIKPLWEKFQNMMSRDKSRKKDREL